MPRDRTNQEPTADGPNDAVDYTAGELVANSLTHVAGALLAAVGLVVLCVVAAQRQDAWRTVGVAVFGASLVALYTASAVYHSVPWERMRPALRKVDHAAIYLLIAGSYTPWVLGNLRGPWGWSVGGVVWGCALLGIAGQVILWRWRHWQKVSLSLYLAMGWTVVVATGPMLGAVAPMGLLLIALGGLAYTSGVVFYLWRSLRYHHAIWHLFVLAGSTLHYFAVLLYLAPPGPG